MVLADLAAYLVNTLCLEFSEYFSRPTVCLSDIYILENATGYWSMSSARKSKLSWISVILVSLLVSLPYLRKPSRAAENFQRRASRRDPWTYPLYPGAPYCALNLAVHISQGVPVYPRLWSLYTLLYQSNVAVQGALFHGTENHCINSSTSDWHLACKALCLRLYTFYILCTKHDIYIYAWKI